MTTSKSSDSKEIKYPSTYNLLSITKLDSHITYASKEFCEVSGYTQEELQGKPHNIVRHPDMPSEAFKNMWEHLKLGKSWMGLVKNKCKNGDYYWVDAFASPIIKAGKTVEYQSVRLIPNSKHVENAEKIYKQIREGRTPRQLKGLRSRLWQRISVIIIPLSIISAALDEFLYQGIGIWLLMITSIFCTYLLTRRLELLSEEARKVFNNPLMELVYNKHVDDISEIQLAFKMRRSEINAIIGRIEDSNENINKYANSFSINCDAALNNLYTQTSETEQVAAAINQMHATANEISQNAQSTSAVTEQASLAASEGVESVKETIDSITMLSNQLDETAGVIAQLEEHGKTIDVALTVIQSIAEQTNLLALNAAIEAARAGEQGRGFAVVADEVRTLAQRSQVSTKEIHNVISLIQSSTQSAVQVMAEGNRLSEVCVSSAELSGKKLSALIHQISDISDRNTQIASAIEEMACVAEEMNSNVQTVNELTTHNNKLASEISEGNESIVENLKSQGELVSQFRSRD
ncbi:methyl-accepting chemotaxis protein [Vibrio vulnificus]|uniref:methyl-accepting chemotaxis protein n=1 Tax=Vibrio vulnificus TaxID=672 RepID=UPI001CDCC7D0|nr:PAS domain-containing methyl-accepting chemotaxis protein [Vibrio vulnificus]MCA3967021.1 methyl-accepting chemotaxis protein [Vibrio vulnificus]